MRAQKPSAAVFFPTGILELHVTVKHFAHIVAQSGFEVEAFVIANESTPPPTSDGVIKCTILPWAKPAAHESPLAWTALFLLWVAPIVFRRRYSIYVGSGIRGLIVASLLSLLTRVPYVYHSTEMYPSWECTSLYRRLQKRFENWAIRRAAAVFIQDPWRGAILAKDSGLAPENIDFFPVSCEGPGEIRRSDYLRNRLGLREQRKIVLYAGNMTANFAPVAELIEAAQSWPEDWLLVMQSNWRVPGEVLREWKAADRNGQVVIFPEPLPHHLLPELLASADVNLVLYRRTDDNMYNMGLSSGKFSESLHVGLPVVVNRWPGLADVVEEFGCGEVIDDFSQVTEALERIFRDRDRYAVAAVRAFTAKLDLRNYADRVRKRTVAAARLS